MSVGKIALGVFLGNLLFGIVAWGAMTLIVDRQETKAAVASTDAAFAAQHQN